MNDGRGTILTEEVITIAGGVQRHYNDCESSTEGLPQYSGWYIATGQIWL